jgi:cysteine desulfurase
MKRIYLDHAASTPVDPRVLAVMQPHFLEKFGNPGSLHSFGQEAIAAVDSARETIAKAIGAEFRQIIFTGSATEANSLALRGAILAARHGGDGAAKDISYPRIIVSIIEHESVLETAREAERMGVEVIYVPVDASGIVAPEEIKKSLNDRTVLVSVMYAQNEIGTVQRIAEIGKALKNFRGENKYPLFHTDAAQAFQFLDCAPAKLGVDLMTLSAHKIYGPKGIGALYIKDPSDVKPIISGGGQEFGLRSGTENVPSIVGFAKAVELVIATREAEGKRIGELRDQFWKGLKEIFPKAEMNGIEKNPERLPNILNIYFPGREAQELLTKLDIAGLAASSGSACRSRAMESSYVIETLGHSKERAKSSIRFSFGRPTTKQEVVDALAVVRAAR